MNKKILTEILSEKSMQLTRQDVMDIMNEELQKEPEDMDTDLVDLCLDVLEGKYVSADTTANEGDNEEKNTGKSKRIKLGRALLVAAVFAVVIAITIPVGAKFVNINASDDMVDYNVDHFTVNMNGKEQSIEDIIDDSVLPSALLGKNCTLSNPQNVDSGVILDFKYNNSEIYGNIAIHYNIADDFLSGQVDMSNEYYSAEEIKVKGIRALIMQTNDYFTIMYFTGGNEYLITIRDCDFETAKQIANTIGE